VRGSIVLPRRSAPPGFLVYGNYRTFLAWNNSTFFAVSVGALADELGQRSSLEICGLPGSSSGA
jgi:membrane-bound lytic murein transglycosylase B